MTQHGYSGCAGCGELLARESVARAAAEAANRAKDEFFRTLSHELRGPLSVILSWVDLLRTGKLDDATAARALETVERSAKAQGRLVDDMLDVTRMTAGKIRLELRPVNLVSLVAETVEAVRPATERGAIRVEIDSRNAIDSVPADPDRLRQVLENLLLNAVKFTPKGGRIVVRLGGDARGATIAVSDTGQGIRPDLLPHVFEPFWQANTAATRLGGLGLGLAIVEHLVELHGGAIVAMSDGEGKGSTFTVTLPTHRGEAVREGLAHPSIVPDATPDVGIRPWRVPPARSGHTTGGKSWRRAVGRTQLTMA